jgi:hypothetical protein
MDMTATKKRGVHQVLRLLIKLEFVELGRVIDWQRKKTQSYPSITQSVEKRHPTSEMHVFRAVGFDGQGSRTQKQEQTL